MEKFQMLMLISYAEIPDNITMVCPAAVADDPSDMRDIRGLTVTLLLKRQ